LSYCPYYYFTGLEKNAKTLLPALYSHARHCLEAPSVQSLSPKSRFQV
jgi:hypothetical protein